ncbi:MAG: VanZ family protein, partial [Gammaproteobacteria bacterium]
TFVIMGVVLEYLQSFDPTRMSEFADMIANSTGVVLGLMLALTKAKFTLVNFEKWIR